MSRLAMAGLAALFIAVAGAFVFAGPVVDYWRDRTARAEDRQEFAEDDGAARGLEVQGTETLANAAAELDRAAADLRSQTHVVEIRTRADPAVVAAGRVPPGELDRLREHDRLLCGRGLECGPGGSSAPPGDAGAGGDEMLP